MAEVKEKYQLIVGCYDYFCVSVVLGGRCKFSGVADVSFLGVDTFLK